MVVVFFIIISTFSFLFSLILRKYYFTMKKIFFPAIIGLAVMFALASCSKKGENTDVTLDVTSVETIPIEGGEVQFGITSNSEWEIIKSDKDEWFVLDTYQGTGDRTVTVDAKSNVAESDKKSPTRTANIVVMSGNLTKIVSLTQIGIDILEVTDPANVMAEGGQVTFDITSNLKWKIAEVTELWVEGIGPLSGDGDATVTVTLEENTGELRSVDITVTAGELTEVVTIVQYGPLPLIDELVGRWRSKGDYVVEFSPSPDDHIVTIEKIDGNTVRIKDLMGVATRFSNMTTEQDTFIATVDNVNRTISIASQPIEPTFALDGSSVYLCRFLYDYEPNFSANWQVGFENIPVSDDLKIDFSAGGWRVGNWNGGAYASFIPLAEPSEEGGIPGFFLWYFTNTVWTKMK